MKLIIKLTFIILFFVSDISYGQLKVISKFENKLKWGNFENSERFGEVNGHLWRILNDDKAKKNRLIFDNNKNSFGILDTNITVIHTPINFKENIYFFTAEYKNKSSKKRDTAMFWQSDGTIAGTYSIPFVPNFEISYSPPQLNVIGDYMYFETYIDNKKVIYTFQNGSEMAIREEIEPLFDRIEIAKLKDLYFLTAVYPRGDGSRFSKLYIYDNNFKLKRLLNNPSKELISAVSTGKLYGNKLLFQESDPIHGKELWVMDIDSLEPRFLVEFRSGYSFDPSENKFYLNDVNLEVFPTGKKIYFIDRRNNGSSHFYSLDSLYAKPRWIDSTYNPDNIKSQFFGALGDLPIFSIYKPNFGLELYSVKDQKDSLIIIKDIWQGFSSSLLLDGNRAQTATLGGKLYFFANDGQHGTELWRTDGTETGTVLCSKIIPCMTCENEILEFKEKKEKLYFIAYSEKTWSTEFFEYEEEQNPVQPNPILQFGKAEWFQTVKGLNNQTSFSCSENGDIIATGEFLDEGLEFLDNNYRNKNKEGYYGRSNFIANLSSTGELKKCIILDDPIPNIVALNSGSSIIATRTGSNDSIFNNFEESDYRRNFSLIKLTKNLDHEWTKKFKQDIDIYKIAKNEKDEFYILGQYNTSTGVDLGSGIGFTSTLKYSYKDFIAKFNSDGRPIWAEPFEIPTIKSEYRDPNIVDFYIGADGGILLLFEESDNDFSTTCVISCNSLGKFKWKKTIEAEGNFKPLKIFSGPFGSTCILGNFNKTIFLSSTWSIINQNGNLNDVKPFFINLSSSSGEVVSGHILGDNSSYLNSVTAMPNGNLLALVSFEKKWEPDIWGQTEIESYVSLIELTFNGEILFEKRLNGIYGNGLSYINVDKSNHLFYAESSFKFFDSTPNIQFLYAAYPPTFLSRNKIDSISFIPYKQELQPDESKPFVIYPNPSVNGFWVKSLIENRTVESINFYNSMGKKQTITIKDPNFKLQLIEYPKLPVGLYWVEIQSAGKKYMYRQMLW